MNSKAYYIIILFTVLGGASLSFAQPANDNYSTAIDISDALWHPGDNTGADANCPCDITKSICDRSSPSCASFIHPVNMCCGVEGIESSIFYKFQLTSADSVFIDFRNISCNPATFFGLTTALQGFVFSKEVDTWCAPCTDSIWDCFDGPDAADRNGVMSLYCTANNWYFIEIDTRRNTFSSCACGSYDPTCHSTCNFEIRIRQKNPTLGNYNFELNESSKGIELMWDKPDECDDITIKRRIISDNQYECISNENCEYYSSGNKNIYIDKENLKMGTYQYKVFNGSSLIGKKAIHIQSSYEIKAYYQPTFKTITISNVLDTRNGVYTLFGTQGQLIANGLLDTKAESVNIPAEKLPPGIYYLTLETMSYSKIFKVVIY